MPRSLYGVLSSCYIGPWQPGNLELFPDEGIAPIGLGRKLADSWLDGDDELDVAGSTGLGTDPT